MKAAWAKRKDIAALGYEPNPFEDAARGRDINVKMELSDGFKEVQRLENELRRRDKELIAEFKGGVANPQTKRVFGMGLVVAWSTIDAILKALPTE